MYEGVRCVLRNRLLTSQDLVGRACVCGWVGVERVKGGHLHQHCLLPGQLVPVGVCEEFLEGCHN